MNRIVTAAGLVGINAASMSWAPEPIAVTVFMGSGYALARALERATRPTPARLDLADPSARSYYDDLDAEAQADVMRDQRARDLSDDPRWVAA